MRGTEIEGLSEEDIAEVLIREGATALAARAAASAANGNLRRARILGRDDELAQRIAQWRSVPDRLNGTPATSAALATEIARALDDAIAPLQQIRTRRWSCAFERRASWVSVRWRIDETPRPSSSGSSDVFGSTNCDSGSPR